MKKETAIKIINLISKSDAIFNQMSEVSLEIEDEIERVSIREGVGKSVGFLYTDVIIPILREYPDLDPDKESG
ncbi:MAG: hypothetical protein KDH19_01870 [Geminicoccaceae bacterium]|nr:hypothetical protein [Geminicoccaceae bacterium]